MDIREITERVGQIASPILESMGLVLVETTYRSEQGRWVLRVTVHKRGGVTLDELGLVNQDLSAALDVDDVVPGRFNLEVSSPGLTRPLREERDFSVFAGSFAQLSVREEGGGTKVLRGTLEGVEGGKVLLATPKGREAVPLADVAKAKLDIEEIKEKKPSREKKR